MKKKLAFLLSVMVLFSVAGYFICTAAGSKQREEENVQVVSSFYPMYVLAQNLLSETEGIAVSNLTENQTGCLHDYQLTTKDMRLLSEAEVFLINGAGMELFMEKVLAEVSELSVIDASAGIVLLSESGHNHEGESETEQEHGENGHVWMDVERHREQAVTTCAELVTLFPEEKEAILQAWKTYDAKLMELAGETDALRELTEGRYVVVFHDAFVYLADSLGMEVISVLALDEETVPSAGEIAEVVEEIHHHGEVFLWIEEAYASHADKIVAETGAKVVYLDPLVTGDGDADGYLNGMKKNLREIEEAIQK